MIALMNVCEHVQDMSGLLKTVYQLLKANGKAVMTIPFMLKIHQAPLDYARYTHFALQKMADEIGLNIAKLDAYVDPAGMISETARYYQFWEIPELNFIQRVFARLFLMDIKVNSFILTLISGQGRLTDVRNLKYPAPTGYQVVLEKSLQRSGE
jgi:hypothetical protein